MDKFSSQVGQSRLFWGIDANSRVKLFNKLWALIPMTTFALGYVGGGPTQQKRWIIV
jgi:hypothetical protein